METCPFHPMHLRNAAIVQATHRKTASGKLKKVGFSEKEIAQTLDALYGKVLDAAAKPTANYMASVSGGAPAKGGAAFSSGAASSSKDEISKGEISISKAGYAALVEPQVEDEYPAGFAKGMAVVIVNHLDKKMLKKRGVLVGIFTPGEKPLATVRLIYVRTYADLYVVRSIIRT